MSEYEKYRSRFISLDRTSESEQSMTGAPEHDEVADDLAKKILQNDLDDVGIDDGVSMTIPAARPEISPERSIKIAYEECGRLASALDLPQSTLDTAKQIFDQFESNEDVNGWVIEPLAAGCLYAACKVNGVPLDSTDFTDINDIAIDQNILLRRTKTVASAVGLDPSSFLDASHYVDHYCEGLSLEEEIQRRAKEILDLCEQVGAASGKDPTGWAAAAVYNATLETDIRRTQDEIAEVANVSNVTIRNRYQDQREVLRNDDTIPEETDDFLNWIDEKIGIDEQILKNAREILESTNPEEYSLSEWSTAWRLAAIRLASTRLNKKIGYRSLKPISGIEGTEIQSKVRELNNGGRSSAVAGSKSTTSNTSNNDSAAWDQKLSKSDIIIALRWVAIKVERAPKFMHIKRFTGLDESQINNKFGSFIEARKAAGVSPAMVKEDPIWDQDNIQISPTSDDSPALDQLFSDWDPQEDGENDMTRDTSSSVDSPETKNAEHEQDRPRDGPSRLDLLTDLLEIKHDLERTPRIADIKAHSSYTVDQYVEEFGSFEAAIEDIT